MSGLIITRKENESFSIIENGQEIAKIDILQQRNVGQVSIRTHALQELTILREELIGDDIERLE